MDLGTQFCERCGRDRDSFPSARNEYRDCPACGAACCADCWNLVDGACLACAPFRLIDATTRPRIVIAPTAAAGPVSSADPYADLRGGEAPPDAWDGTRGTARQRPKGTPPAGVSPPPLGPDGRVTSVADGAAAVTARRPVRRAGRLGLAASAAWVVVAMLAVVALGASPQARVPAPPEATPWIVPSLLASPPASQAPSRPAATPRATRAPRATPRPTPRARPVNPGVTAPRATPKATPKPTPRPVKPVVVAPPPPPKATAAPTPDPTPVPTSELSPETSAP